MILYKEDGMPTYISTKESNIINNGENGIVYGRNNDECTKLYKVPTKSSERINELIFQIIRIINSDYMVKMLEALYDGTNSFLTGYQMKFVPSNNERLLLLPMNYFLDSVNGIELLFEKLSQYLILVNDVFPANSIVSKDNITLLDPDSYCFYKVTENMPPVDINKTVARNRRQLLIFLENLMIPNLRECLKNKDIANAYKLNKRLFSQEIDSEKSVSHQLKKHMNNYKYPIDYFLSKGK